ncbi:MAG: lysophospholipase [Anaerolineae bacterium]|nr:lysophospholipase [Anaerolineae bacterium]
MIIIHGIGEHGDRHAWLGTHLASHGYLCIAPDLRGHGQSPGQRGHVDRFEDYLADVDAARSYAASEIPKGNLYLFGHSLGGLIVLAHALARPGDWSGVIASAPALARRMPTPTWVSLVIPWLHRLWPTFSSRTGPKAEWLSHNPATISDYRSDPLVHDRITARAFAEMERVAALVRAAAAHLQIPLLLLQGTDDPIVDPDAVQRFYAQVAVPGSRLATYPGTLHEAFNEAIRPQVQKGILTWLEERESRGNR